MRRRAMILGRGLAGSDRKQSVEKPRGSAVPGGWLLLVASLPLLAASGALAEGIRTERVRFAPGTSSAVVEASITGDEIVDYVLGARAGQALSVSMATPHTAAYFNLMAPGETQVAFFNGSVGENQYEGILPETGDYRVRVYMMRSAARRNEKADYRLEMIITASDAGGEAP